MRKASAFVMTAALGLLTAVTAHAGDKEADLSDAKCPLSGKAVNAATTTDYKGGTVYFCCAGCSGAFEKNPDKYAAKANHQLVVTGQADQVACPLTGRPIDESKSSEIAGVTVSYCCGGCQSKVASAGEKEQVEMVFVKGFDKAFQVAEDE